MEDECVVILLAAYNGEKYIAEQIDSILSQSYHNWRLLIRMDASSDDTERIINEYANQDIRISILDNKGLRLGAQLNFGALMLEIANRRDYKYIMFCDQDDVWDSNKVELSLISIKEEIKKRGEHTPLLIHTDFQYADQYLSPLSMQENVALKLSLTKNKLALIANDNYIFGCTMIINLALLKLAVPVSESAENHDYWIALHAAAFGEIVYIHQKTMLYRQHDNNVSAGIEYSSFRNRIKRISNFDTYIKLKNIRRSQFYAFFNKERNLFPKDQRKILELFLEYSKRGGLRAVLFMFRNNFKLRGPIQTLMYYISLAIDHKD